MASELAGIYLKLNNTGKYMQYAEKIVAQFPMSQAYVTALQMAEIYLKQQNLPKALDLLSKVMAVYGDQVPPGSQEASWNKTRVFAFSAIAADAYAKKDYAKTIDYYERVAFYDRQNCDAYYYIAMCKWNGGDQAAAIPYFARASVLNDKRSIKAREYLEQLYRAENSDSLDGLEELLAQAKADLGIS
jgi:tetratricopeptide (TPR) repeat protein